LDRRRIAADINELYLLGTSLRFDTSWHRPALGVVCAAIVNSLIFPKSAFSAFDEKLRNSMAYAHAAVLYVRAVRLYRARRWLADALVKDIGIIRAFDRNLVALLP